MDARTEMALEAYCAERDLWLARREHATALYPGDVTLWEQDHPKPRFRDFLIATRRPR